LKNWIIAGFLLVAVSSFCFVMFIVFNWAMYNHDSGIYTILNSFADQFFNRYYNQWWDGINNSISFGFGLSGVICMALALVCFVAHAFGGERKTEVY